VEGHEGTHWRSPLPMSEAGSGSTSNTFLSDWKSFSQQAAQDMPLPKLGHSFFSAEKGSMEDLTNFGKSLQGSLTSGFTAVTAGVDLQGVTSSLTSAASSTSTDIFNFGRGLQRDANDAAVNMATGANQVGSFVSTGATSAASQIAAGTREFQTTLANLSRERVMYFFALSLAGTLMLFLAVFVGIPTIALAPAKFAICFSVGSACTMSAVGALRGPMAQINHMIAQERLMFSASYVASLLATLYCSVVMHSYILTIISSVLQLVALVYYQVSYFPMGAQGLKVVGQMGYHIAKPFVFGAGRAMGLIKPKTFLPL